MGGLSDMYCKASGAEYGATRVARVAREVDELLGFGIPDRERELRLLVMLDGAKERAAGTARECREALPEASEAMDSALSALVQASILLGDERMPVGDGKGRIGKARGLVGEARRSAALAAGLAHVELAAQLDEMEVGVGGD